MMSQSVQRNEGTDAEMVEEYLAISRLQDMGLNQSDVKKLEDAGYKSVGMVISHEKIPRVSPERYSFWSLILK